MRSLEGGAATVAMGSGMAAISHTLLGLLEAGNRIVVHRSLFVGVRTLLDDFVAKLGIDVVCADLNDSNDLARVLEKPTRLVYFETVSNPNLEVIDAPGVIAAARQAGVIVVVDNTILTPFLFKPLACGADVVIHSATKYLSGHGDVLAGMATFQDAVLGQRVHKSRRILGGLLNPLGAFLVMRGMKTLPLRMARHCENAQKVAEYLQQHPRVKKVHYPGLPQAPGHARASTFLSAFGGIVSFEPRDDFEWESFSKKLRVCCPGMSFGDAANARTARRADSTLRGSGRGRRYHRRPGAGPRPLNRASQAVADRFSLESFSARGNSLRSRNTPLRSRRRESH